MSESKKKLKRGEYPSDMDSIVIDWKATPKKLKRVRYAHADWIKEFDERQREEIEFAQTYADFFAHGTDGHNAKMIIAKMVQLLDEQAFRLGDVGQGMVELAQTEYEIVSG